MSPQINSLFNALEGKSPSILLWEEKLINALGNPQALLQFISDLQNEMYLTKDFHDNRFPFYHFLLSIAYYEITDHPKAKDSLANSILGFRTQDLNLNEAIGEFLFGLIHRKSGRNERAQRANDTASAILHGLIQQCEIQRSYQRAKKYKRHLSRIRALNRMINSQSATDKKEETPSTNIPLSYKEGYLLFQWLPTYENVRAGKNGISWANPSPHNGTIVYVVELDGVQHKVFSVQSTEKIRDHQITLSSEKNYGWAKVKGKSMNASKPISIEEGNYVLFSSTWDDTQDAIVIAGCKLTDHETSMMVKKYLANEKKLISETVELDKMGDDYSPIELKDNTHQILGTVLAIAKPA